VKRLYLVEFTETVEDDGVLRPVLPWDGMSVNVHCVYPRAEKGTYTESHVIALVAADEKTHEQIAAMRGVTILPDDASAKLKDIPQEKRAEVEQKAVDLKADTKDITQESSVKEVVDLMGKRLKPTFDLARLSVAQLDAVKR